MIEYISLVIIEIGHSVFICIQSVLNVFLVIDISTFHLEQFVKHICSINGISYPVNIANIITVAFFYSKIDINGIVTIVDNAVLYNGCVTKSKFIVFFNYSFFVFCIAFLNEFLSLEQTLEPFLVGFL